MFKIKNNSQHLSKEATTYVPTGKIECDNGYTQDKRICHRAIPYGLAALQQCNHKQGLEHSAKSKSYKKVVWRSRVDEKQYRTFDFQIPQNEVGKE